MKLALRKSILGFAPLMYMGLFLFLFLRAYSPGRSVDNFAEQSAALLVALILITGILFVFTSSRIKDKHLAFLFLLACAFGVSIISSTVGYYTGQLSGVINNFTQQILFFILMVMIVSYRPWQDINFTRVLAHLLTVFAVLTAIVGWQVLLTGQGFFGPLSFGVEAVDLMRLTGFHASSNYSGLALALGLISAVYFSCVNRDNKFWAYFVILFLGLSLVATGSRGSMLVGASGLFGFFFLHSGRRFFLNPLFVAKIFIVLIIGTLLIFSFYLLIPDDYLVKLIIESAWHRVTTRTASVGGLENEARIVFLKQGIEFYAHGTFLDQILGFGNGAYMSIFGRSPHNSFLLVIFERGLLSFLILFSMYVWIFYLLFFFNKSTRTSINRCFLMALLLATLARGLFQAGALLGFEQNSIVVLSIAAIAASKHSTTNYDFLNYVKK